MDIPLYGLCVGIATETFRNQKKKYLIDRFINIIDILQRVYVFNGVPFFKQMSEIFHISISERVKG